MVERIDEVVEVDCNSTVSSFMTSVFVDFEGDPNSATSEEIRALEVSFRDTYNGLQSNLCDEWFREIEEVSVDLSSVRRLQVSNNITNTDSSVTTFFNSTRVDFRFQFIVFGRCRGCPAETNIFDDGIRGRLLLSQRGSERRLQQVPSACFCPADNREFSGSPSEEEFMLAYNDTITDLRDDGVLENIVTVSEDAVEVNQFDCPEAVNSIDTSTFLSLAVASLSIDQPVELGTVYKDTYNSLAFDICDPFFRRVSSVSVGQVFNDTKRA